MPQNRLGWFLTQILAFVVVFTQCNTHKTGDGRGPTRDPESWVGRIPSNRRAIGAHPPL